MNFPSLNRNDAPAESARKARLALTLNELLCVVAIIAILLALYLPAIARAFVRVKRFLLGE